MIIKSTDIILKNKETVSIELCSVDDAEELIKTVKKYLADSEYLLTSPNEFDPSPEQERSWIRSFMENENSLLLIAKKGNKIIGNIDITGGKREMTKHTAIIGMGILKEWRNTGLGTALLNKGIEWAKQNPQLEILWLQVFAQNTPAITLYKKAGFEVSGIQKRFFKSKDNIYFDNVIMSLNVSN
jgi:RimJ/RimL family protein N-acetyltransferase